MKKQMIIAALGTLLLSSCADEFDRHFEVGRPGNLEQYAYLNDYGPLKGYIDQSQNPNFMLGVGTDAADYANQGPTYVVTNANFTETVAGNAMKMASCVDDKGSMNFATVESYVKTAYDAGMNVYGHTLAWHAQQPVKWLNSLLADKPAEVSDAPKVKVMQNVIINSDLEGGDNSCFATKENAGDNAGTVLSSPIQDGIGKDGSRGIAVTSTAGAAEDWDAQFWIVLPEAVPEGTNYHVTFDYKASRDASADTQAHYNPGEYQHWAMVGSPTFTTEWQTWDASGTIDGSQAGANGMKSIAFNLSKDRDNDVTYYFDNIVVEIETEVASGPVTYMAEMLTNCDMEGDGNASFVTKENAGANAGQVLNSTIQDGIGKDGSRGIAVTSSAGAAEDWDAQFWIVLPEAIPEGTNYHCTFDYKASRDVSADTQAHYNPGEYQHWAMLGSPTFTTEWQTWDVSGTIDGSQAGANGMKSIAFNLSKDRDNDVTFYFDNIHFEIEKTNTGGGIPLTPEEKKDTLLWAMDKWISGMMDACMDDDGTMMVKAWDVVNEAISGADTDGDGNYDLQHGTADNTTDFFWQDYLGDLDYVRSAVKLARQYGGSDLKLFINDYNLESDWDNNKKLKSLINWIQKWEADGITKIDGIGSQMHISYYCDAKTQESKKNAVTESFKLMAATGKLIRISELDMGIVDENGKDILTPDVTEEQHHAMADYYKWIIQQYLTIIPAAQQWGICQWCATDSPAGSGWRAGQPVGLWDENFYRKHTYAGFADGLQGK